MSAHDWAFIAAGSIGAFVAIIHGLIMQKIMITPILREMNLPEPTRRLVPLLLHFSTLAWFFGGVALIAAPFLMGEVAMRTTAIFVGAFYTFGALGNLWGTRGRHPGWILLAIAAVLIVYGLMGAAG